MGYIGYTIILRLATRLGAKVDKVCALPQSLAYTKERPSDHSIRQEYQVGNRPAEAELV